MSKPFIPTKLKMIKGTARDSRIKDEPEPEPSIPSPPDFLDQVACVEWGRVSTQLFKLGLLSELDRTSLAVYCRYYSLWKRAEEESKKTDEILMTKQGNVIQNPWRGIANTAVQIMEKAAMRFGMNPESRARVSSRRAESGKKEGFGKFKKKA